MAALPAACLADREGGQPHHTWCVIRTTPTCDETRNLRSLQDRLYAKVRLDGNRDPLLES
ncbi:hypothetical protein TIFTF001_035286 [Ficus carica]|uniref:Uncharacterized protein n=1 Tax=Ficus carica TaxID=3494 RepID=A0AA88J9U5_FICCA|nr:hypothetical protein TIFTF001_035286 [Ficus carica]